MVKQDAEVKADAGLSFMYSYIEMFWLYH